MSDARRYAIRPDPRSRSISHGAESLKFFHFQNLPPPTLSMGAGKSLLISKFVRAGFLYICPIFVSRDFELRRKLRCDIPVWLAGGVDRQ